jgi:hypothetical protein
MGLMNSWQRAAALLCWASLLAGSALAQSTVFATPAEYLDHLNRTGSSLGYDFSEWTPQRGDVNGDGIEDVAIILSYSSDGPGGIRTRLVVLAGRADGGCAVLSESARYCDAQKFFNLRIEKGSLYAEAVQKADSMYFGSDTLQFRFNKRHGDLEVIGQALRWDSYDDESSGSWSRNFLTGVVVESEGVRGRTIKSKRSKEQRRPLMRLNGFDCNNLE